MNKLYKSSEENVEPIEGRIQGETPKWLAGSLLRNGAGIYEVGEDKFQHPMDPLAIFHKFDFKDGKVTYLSKYLRSENYKRNMEAKQIVCRGMGTMASADPNKNILQRFAGVFKPDENDNTIVSFFAMKDNIYAASETTFLHKVDPVTLDTVARVDLKEKVGVQSASPHPHWDQDGTLHNIGYSYKKGAEVCFFKYPAEKMSDYGDFPQGEIVGLIKCNAKMSSSLIHSFAMTENYYVYIEQPLILHIFKLLTSKIRMIPYSDAMEWKSDMKCRFHIVDKKTGKELNANIRYEAEQFMVFHHINAYEDNGHVVVDICCMEDNKSMTFVTMKQLQAPDVVQKWKEIRAPGARRYVLPLTVDTSKTSKGQNLVTLEGHRAGADLVSEHSILCTHEDLASVGLENPRINYGKCNGKKYKYFYGTGWHTKGDYFYTVAKVNVESKTQVEWAEKDSYPSEPIFVPNPDGTDEDDGVVLSAVNHSEPGDDGHEEAFLLVLDAKTMKEIARATFGLERFPKDFHGIFIPNRSS